MNPLRHHKDSIRHRWASSPDADDMSLATFNRFLTALDAARSHAEISVLVKKWKDETKGAGNAVR